MSSVERVKTGVSGLDSFIQGGFPKGNCILVSGQAGAGKTILGVQFLYEGAKNGEKGVYLAYEEKPEQIIKEASVFFPDFKKYVDNGKITIKEMYPMHKFANVEKILGGPIYKDEFKRKSKYSRIVLDSLPSLLAYIHDGREEVHNIVSLLKNSGATSIVISETYPESNKFSSDGYSEFLADGVIVLTVQKSLDLRKIEIAKIRQTKHSLKPRNLQITTKGLSVE